MKIYRVVCNLVNGLPQARSRGIVSHYDRATGLQNAQTENSRAVRAKICERIAPGAQRRTSQSEFFKLFRRLETVASREKVSSQQQHMPGGGSGIRTHDTVSRIHAFQACALSHSAI